MRLVIADAHAGLAAAADRTIQGAGRQRCRVHFIRNLLALVPRTHQHMAAAVFRTVFAQPDPEAVDAAWDEVAAQLGARFPKVAALMADAKPEVLAFAAFPRAHWQKIWSTNPLERINKEIKRRSRVVGIFPNQASAIRLVGAILADLHDEWQATERRYLSEHSMATLCPRARYHRHSRAHTRQLTPRLNPKAHHSTQCMIGGCCRLALPLHAVVARSRLAAGDTMRTGRRGLIAPLCQVAAFWRVRSASVRRVR